MSEALPWARLRARQYDEIYVSPHMDDAVYSCGGQIAQRRAEGARVLVLTVFGNGRDDEQGSGVFGDIATRKREERAAMDVLDVDHVWLNLPDLLVRPKSALDVARYALPFVPVGNVALQRQLAASVVALRRRLLARDGALYFPLAVGFHPDHRIVFEAGAGLLEAFSPWFYEDNPYAETPAMREARLHQLGLSTARMRWGASSEVHDFVFMHAPRWQRPFGRAGMFAYWSATELMARARRGAFAGQAFLERDITDVIERKVEAMRAYATQTAYFYPPGDALYARLSRAGERYVERYWQLVGETAPFRLTDSELNSALARVDATLART